MVWVLKGHQHERTSGRANEQTSGDDNNNLYHLPIIYWIHLIIISFGWNFNLNFLKEPVFPINCAIMTNNYLLYKTNLSGKDYNK